MPEYAVVGRSIPRVDGEEKVTGQARFTGDLRIPGLLHVRLVLSPYANARIVSIDTSEAEKMPGVVGVYRAADLPFAEPESGNRKRDFMARDRALYHGHPVLAVVAESGAAAEDTLASFAPDAPKARGEKPIEESAEAAMHGGGGSSGADDHEVLPPNVS